MSQFKEYLQEVISNYYFRPSNCMFQEGRLAKMMTTTKLVFYDLISVRKDQKLLNTGWLKPHKEPPASGFFLNKRLWNLSLKFYHIFTWMGRKEWHIGRYYPRLKQKFDK